jgi:hypothetical protein
MSSDALSQKAAQLDREDEERSYRGRVSYTKKEVDRAVLEASDDDRLAIALLRAAGIFEAASMPFTSELLRRVAKILGAGVSE